MTVQRLSVAQTNQLLNRDVTEAARQLVENLTQQGQTIACAESLTGGLLADAIVSVPGASAVFKGSAVTYATESKNHVLGVAANLLAASGPVDPTVALQMARGTRTLFNAEVGVSTTGVAGPTPQDSKPIGLVYVAIVGAEELVYELDLTHRKLSDAHSNVENVSQRELVRSRTVSVLLGLLTQVSELDVNVR